MAVQKITEGTVLALAAAGIIAVALVGGLLAATQTVNNTGTVEAAGVGVFWDRNCTNKTSSIDWGILSPGGARSNTVYINNSGNVGLNLSMTTSAWVPSNASSSISLSWNCTGYVLSHASVIAANLTLSVSPSISDITNFSFNVTITGTENT